MEKKIVDARGLACPLPVVNAKKAAAEMKEGGVLTVLVDNEIAVQNLQKFAKQKGYASTGEKKAEKEYEVVIQVSVFEGTSEPVRPEAEDAVCTPDTRKNGMVADKTTTIPFFLVSGVQTSSSASVTTGSDVPSETLT